MTWAEFDAWSPRSRRGFAAHQVAAGLAAWPEAGELAEKVFADLLPEGPATPGHLLWTVHPAGQPTAGYLWLQLRPLGGEVEAYVMDVEVLPEARGRGLGHATMLAAEQVARDLGADVVRLNVFAHNVAAVRLYDRLGYRASTLTLTAHLPPSSRPGFPLSRPGFPSSRREFRGRHVDGATTAYDGDLPVARLRLDLEHRPNGVHAFARVVDGSAGPDPRHAEAVMVAARAEAVDLGAAAVSVAVPAPSALSLTAPHSEHQSEHGSEPRDVYERAGFTLTAMTLWKAM